MRGGVNGDSASVARYTPNATLRAVRLGMGLSQDSFADGLGAFMRTRLGQNVAPAGNLVGMWERGEARPGPLYRSGLITYTGCGAHELGLASGVSPPSSVIRGPEEDQTERRELLADLMAAGLMLAGLGLPPRLRQVPDRVEPEHVEEISRLTGMYRAWIYQHGAGAEARAGIAELLRRTTGLISHAGDQQLRRGLLDATADLAGLAAYAQRDQGSHELAQRYYLLALQAAKAADDQALAGHLVVRMAGHHIELAQPADVFDYLASAARAGRGGGVFTAGQRSNQHAIAAWAHAQTGNSQQVHRAVGAAEEDHASAEGSGGPDWQIRHVAEAELHSLTGAAYTELARRDPRHADQAISRLSRALHLRGIEGARNAALDTISLAEAHLHAGHLDQAAVLADTATARAGCTSSLRIRTRIGELADSLTPHRGRNGIDDTLARLHQAARRSQNR
jgi:hypothetical protein